MRTPFRPIRVSLLLGPMELSIIVPAHNEERHVVDQMEAILAQDLDVDWEVIVVDNNSTDNTASLVQESAQRSSRLRLVQASEQCDKSYALAAGVANSSAELLVFCDADDIVAPGWLAAMADGLKSHEVVTGPNELDALNPSWLANSRGRSGDDAVGTYAGIFPCIRGNNFGLHRSVWDSVGPFHVDFYPVEDIEYSYRCWTNGIEIVGLPDAVVHYRYRDSSSALWRQGLAYGSHRPLIAKLLKEAGKPTPPRFSGWKSWAMLVVKIPMLTTRSGRSSWLWIAGNRLGQLVGSIRYRTMML